MICVFPADVEPLLALSRRTLSDEPPTSPGYCATGNRGVSASSGEAPLECIVWLCHHGIGALHGVRWARRSCVGMLGLFNVCV